MAIYYFHMSSHWNLNKYIYKEVEKASVKMGCNSGGQGRRCASWENWLGVRVKGSNRGSKTVERIELRCKLASGSSGMLLAKFFYETKY